MIIKKFKRLYNRRKAVSPVIAAILLIALTVTAVAIVFFIVMPALRTYRLSANIVKIYDTNKDSLYDQIEIQLVNSGTKTLNITRIVVWICAEEDLGNSDNWLEYADWTFVNPQNSIINPSEISSVLISGTSQIGLTINEFTWYRLDVFYTGAAQPYRTSWALLNDLVDLSDLLSGFQSFNLTAYGFEGTIDDPSRAANNYRTNPNGDFQLFENQINLLPVLDEDGIPFFVGTRIVVFHSTNGNLTGQPLEQKFDFSSTPFRAKKLFLLGLAGSWGDHFTLGSWALNLTIVYTDNSYTSHLLNHSYIDDWWHYSNNFPPPSGPRYDGCLSHDKYGPGFITHIDLGTQVDTPNSHIHTHSTRFYFDFYKYIKYIIFTDPGNDQSGPHLLSITMA